MSERGDNRAFLSSTDFLILQELLNKDKQTGQEISNKIERDKTKVSLRLIRLEKLGLIKREPEKSKGHKTFNSIKNKTKVRNFFDIVNRGELTF
jgi:predicted transcriptional regulator